jgi:predicted transcriptional regulator of viral defense system
MKDKTLLTRSAQFFNRLREEKIVCFSTEDAQSILKASNREATRKLLSELVKRGWLLRLKRGLYYLIPFDEDPKTFFPDWHLLAQFLTKDVSHYIGYYNALQIYSLSTQPSLREQIVVNRQFKPSTIRIKGIPFQFIYHNEKHFFGATSIWIDNFNKVVCSELEKTFIDCLFKPQYGGGIVEIAKALEMGQEQLDFDKMYQYLLRFDSQAIIKRLGFLLEILEIATPLVQKLKKIKSPAFTLLDPSHPKEGKMLSRWSIRINVDVDTILSSIFT